MDPALILDNLLTPPILFFLLGMIATLVKSDLTIPEPIAKALSLYLLFSIGLLGGVKLAETGLTTPAVLSLGVAVLAASLVPIWSFFVLRWKLNVANAAAVAATYGSVSAVTFITAISFLDTLNIDYSGHMIAAMALMESPAIIVGIMLMRVFGESKVAKTNNARKRRHDWRELIRESLFNGAVLLLLGAMLIGIITGKDGWERVKPFSGDMFTGALCLFLLDMGLIAAQRLRSLQKSGAFLIGFAIVSAPIHAALGIAAAWAIGLGPGDALLLAVLCGSASYIAVPAAMRLAIPSANPSLYVPMALAITFPFNIALGIPLYLAVIKTVWSVSMT